MRAARERTLRASFDHFRREPPAGATAAFEAFCADPGQRRWLEDWVLFSAIKAAHGGREWTSWEPGLRDREPSALRSAAHDLQEEAAYHRYSQFLFFRQWAALRDVARSHGIAIMGDVPIYPAFDSAEVWAARSAFELDAGGHPLRVAGVPPDYFSPTGQRWGNPLFRWDRLAAEGFDWWIERLRANLRVADLVRLDHFRGFAGYWAIPADEPTAVNGTWVEGPGEALFVALRRELGDLPLIAEDLGVITPDVEALRDRFDLPGMRVLQFGFGYESGHSPHDVPARSVVYTGTHDNDTSQGWFGGLGAPQRQRVLDYLGGGAEQVAWSLLRAAHTCAAELAIAPLQDVLGLGTEARMNTPGKADGNWTWRVRAEQVSATHRQRLARLTAASEREPRLSDAPATAADTHPAESATPSAG